MKLNCRCVSCKAERVIDYEESKKIAATGGIPMCAVCGNPMVVKSVIPTN